MWFIVYGHGNVGVLSLRTDFILNEKEFVEKAIQDHDLGKRPTLVLSLAAKLWNENGYSAKEISGMLEDLIIRSDPNASIIRWQSSVDYAVKHRDKRKLLQIDRLPITRLEMDICKTVGSVQKQRLLFTLFAIGKYEHCLNEKNEGWINTPDSKIFSMANVVTSVRRQSLLLNELMQVGYISFPNNVDNISMKLNYMDLDSPAFVYIDQMENLGNLYMYFTNPKYMKCTCCGKIVKKKANNQKYCKECARKVNIEKTASSTRERLIQEENDDPVVTDV